MRTRLRPSTLVAIVIGLLLIPATALAYAPSGDDFITCAAGDENVECVAGVFEEGCAGQFQAVEEGGDEFASGSTTNADADGEVEFEFATPESETDVRVTVECGAKVLSESFSNLSAEDGAEDDEDIAATGSNAGLLALGALGALGIGGAALFVSKRKHTGTSA